MTKKQINTLMTILLNVAAVLVLIGAIFELQHWAYGNPILWTGLGASIILGRIEIDRLKQKIKTLENNS